jgi:hypothetical protein
MRPPAVWSNGDAATASESFSHRNISRGSRCAATPVASTGVVRNITTRRSRRTRNTSRCAGTARRNGAPGIRIIGGGIASSTLPQSSGIASNSTFGTKSGVCAILQTTTQFLTSSIPWQRSGCWAADSRILQTTTRLRRKSGFWKHFRPANHRSRNLANNNVLVRRRLLPDN